MFKDILFIWDDDECVDDMMLVSVKFSVYVDFSDVFNFVEIVRFE